MWVRMRLDIGWLDVLAASAYCGMPGGRAANERAMSSWSDRDDFLITLSVRSAFDLMLRALQLPRGSEVLLSALTVPDMVRIVEMHGLVPVPVDTDDSGVMCMESLRNAVSRQSRMVVVPAIGDARQATTAKWCWEHVVFLPWYPEMPDDSVDQMARIIEPFCIGPVDSRNGCGAKADKPKGEHLGRKNYSDAG